MAPETRSRGQPVAERVYHSSPAPTQRQLRFPPKKKIVRTYGRNHPRLRRSLGYDTEFEASDNQVEHAPAQEQASLTQMGFEVFKAEDTTTDAPNDSSRRKKRRKTEGDAPESSPRQKNWHTQSITQMMRDWPSESDRVNIQIDDSDDDENLDKASNASPKKHEGETRSRSPSVILQTPTMKRVRVEIPSSQDSPISPMLKRYSPAPNRSPLKEKSTNIKSPLPKLSSPQKRPRSLVIEDSYATNATKSPTASAENQSPEQVQPQAAVTKTVRFVTPLLSEPSHSVASQVLSGRDASESDSLVAPPSPTPVRRSPALDRVIADSEDEDDDFDTPTEESDCEDEYGTVGQETQLLVDSMLSSSEKASAEKESLSVDGHSDTSHENPPSSASGVAGVLSSAPTEVATVQLSSPRSLRRRKAEHSSLNTLTPTQDLSSEDENNLDVTPTQRRMQAVTQGLESQRIPLSVIHGMGPQTDRSDIFISIHPEHVEHIVAGRKNHEFRNYKIPNMVSRMWIYVTAPMSELRHMACISNAKQPGEIEDETGIGNAEFNANRSQGGFAYELLDVYRLNNPATLKEMKEHGWLAGPPQKYNYVPPAVVGHLMANLQCSIFGRGEDEEADARNADIDIHPSDDEGGADIVADPPPLHPQPGSQKMTVSQEVSNQLLSEATQLPSESDVSIVPSSQDAEPEICTQGQYQSGTRNGNPPTSWPTRLNPTPQRGIRPSQATTASQPSTQSSSPIKSVPRPIQQSSSSLCFVHDLDENSPIHLPPGDFQLASSQLLSKSQMLPESLLEETNEADEPIDIVYDSERDEEA